MCVVLVCVFVFGVCVEWLCVRVFGFCSVVCVVCLWCVYGMCLCVFNLGLKQGKGRVVPGVYSLSRVRAMLENFNSFGASLKKFWNIAAYIAVVCIQ